MNIVKFLFSTGARKLNYLSHRPCGPVLEQDSTMIDAKNDGTAEPDGAACGVWPQCDRSAAAYL